jgi:hypothetical protein
LRGVPKITPIKPKGEINERIYKAIIDKQGNDNLYDICKKLKIYAGTFRRTLENKHTWSQAKLLYKLSHILGKSNLYLLTGSKTPSDIHKDINAEIRKLKRLLKQEREKNKKILERLDSIIQANLK